MMGPGLHHPTSPGNEHSLPNPGLDQSSSSCSPFAFGGQDYCSYTRPFSEN